MVFYIQVINPENSQINEWKVLVPDNINVDLYRDTGTFKTEDNRIISDKKERCQRWCNSKS